jgi:c-di-GMP-binding flagellar brake protein YcgR
VPVRIAQVVASALAPRAGRYPSMGSMIDAIRTSTKTPLPPSLPPPMRRMHPRASYVTAVRVKRANGDTLDGHAEDISEGGMLVLVPGAGEVREEVLVRFALPSSSKMVSLSAHVRWTRATRGGTHAIGIRFVDPGEKVESDIRAYVKIFARE